MKRFIVKDLNSNRLLSINPQDEYYFNDYYAFIFPDINTANNSITCVYREIEQGFLKVSESVDLYAVPIDVTESILKDN